MMNLRAWARRRTLRMLIFLPVIALACNTGGGNNGDSPVRGEGACGCDLPAGAPDVTASLTILITAGGALLDALDDVVQLIAGQFNAAADSDDDLVWVKDDGTTTEFLVIGLRDMVSGGLLAPLGTPTALAGGDSGPTGVAAGDFDGDGDLDVVIVHNNRTAGPIDGFVTTVLNDEGVESGSLSLIAGGASDALAVGSDPQRVAVGRFDGSADLQAVTANMGTNDITFLANPAGTGDLTVGASVPVPGGLLGPVALVAGDFDGGGGNLDDVALVDGSNLIIVLNAGAPALNQSIPVPNQPEHIVAADFDGDGDTDLAVGSTTAQQVRIFGNNGSGIFSMTAQSPLEVGGPGRILDLGVGEFAAGGNPDLAMLQAGSPPEVRFLINDQAAPALFDLPANSNLGLPAGSAPVSLAIMDYDGDGQEDVAVAETGTSPQQLQIFIID